MEALPAPAKEAQVWIPDTSGSWRRRVRNRKASAVGAEQSQEEIMEEIINTWLSKLESRQYKQGSGSLRNIQDEYCCLGILCEISKLGDWEESIANTSYGGTEPIFRYFNEESFLPSEVQEVSKIRSGSGNFQITDEWWEQLPEEVKEKIGPYLRDQNNRSISQGRNPTPKYYLPREDSLAGLNDAHIEFRVIAEVIRSNPKGLFVEDV